MCTCVKVVAGVIHSCFYLDRGGTYGVTMVLGFVLVKLIMQAAIYSSLLWLTKRKYRRMQIA